MTQQATEKESAHLEKSLLELAECEQRMDKAEREAEIFRIKNTQSIYEDRRSILLNIPQFWYIVLAENEDFAEYMSVDDLQYLETISDVYIHHKVVDTNDTEHYKDFSIIIAFKDEASDSNAIIESQTITKHFKTVIEDGEEKITSEPVDIKWPKSLDGINPNLIKSNAKGELTTEEKKNYRTGMKSFFAWFGWTGTKPGKEYRNGEELARLIVDDIFPYAVKYYTEALPAGEGEDDDLDDSEEGEELDISEDEDDEEESGKKRSPEDSSEAANKKSKH